MSTTYSGATLDRRLASALTQCGAAARSEDRRQGMTFRMGWDEPRAREVSVQAGSMAQSLQTQSTRLSGGEVDAGDASRMIGDQVTAWATELDLRGQALDVWSQAIAAQTDAVQRTDANLRLT